MRGRAGTALVGSHAEVADLIEEYHAIGVEEFVLSGYPHLEEAFWFGEGVRPILARRGLLVGTGPESPSSTESSVPSDSLSVGGPDLRGTPA